MNVIHSNKYIVVEIQVANGEIFDKLSILQIKKEKIQDQDKLKNIEKEFAELQKAYDIIINATPASAVNVCNDLYKELIKINGELWEIEDKLRKKEAIKKFDVEFIGLARQVYFTNDLRCNVKKEINGLTLSNIVEEKSYEKYD